VAQDPGFRHEAVLYAGQGELAAWARGFVADAMDAGEPILVALGSRAIAELRGWLGPGHKGVFLVDMEVLGHNPARIIPTWNDFVEQHGPTAPALRGIGEPVWAGRGGAELVECHQHEALLNVAFDWLGTNGGPSFWLTCPYDTAALDPAVVDAARETHPLVRTNGLAEPSDRYRGVAAAELLAEPLPSPVGPTAEMAFDRSLVLLRRFVAEQALQLTGDRLDRRTLHDVVLAVEELGANSVRYGGGGGRVRIWREAETLLCEVSDQGHITDPLVGRRRPDERQLGGRGLWLVHQLCDLVQVRSSPATGTITRLHMRLD
jgi:anti-sigma regulatory factor (Ser/Thr protein kinase)